MTRIVQLVVELPERSESQNKAEERARIAQERIVALYPGANIETHIWEVRS
jgi:hypothetical protein